MSRNEPPPKRETPKYGEGAAMVELGQGAAADFIRAGGERCPLCGERVIPEAVCVDGMFVTADIHCGCGFRAKAVYRLIDAEL